MEDERVISFERGKQLAEQLGVEFFETSAKENINVKVREDGSTVSQRDFNNGIVCTWILLRGNLAFRVVFKFSASVEKKSSI